MFFGKKSVWAMDLNVAYVHYAKYGQLENFSDRSDECASTPFLLIYKSRLRGGLICGTPHIYSRFFCARQKSSEKIGHKIKKKKCRVNGNFLLSRAFYDRYYM